MTIPIHDRAVCKTVQHVFTSALAYEVFQKAAKDGRFDGLRPVEADHKYGAWIWAGGVMDEAQVKALNEVAGAR
ncbi:hypothetical protein AB0I81_05980 [Nonomuraea sp. NPDC050404]|uniref:hypothetical protein n=1 Tax=Nonomuraea sp. NPDC050404 TaxID=3155783 RepID=UPI0033C82BBB